MAVDTGQGEGRGEEEAGEEPLGPALPVTRSELVGKGVWDADCVPSIPRPCLPGEALPLPVSVGLCVARDSVGEVVADTVLDSEGLRVDGMLRDSAGVGVCVVDREEVWQAVVVGVLKPTSTVGVAGAEALPPPPPPPSTPAEGEGEVESVAGAVGVKVGEAVPEGVKVVPGVALALPSGGVGVGVCVTLRHALGLLVALLRPVAVAVGQRDTVVVPVALPMPDSVAGALGESEELGVPEAVREMTALPVAAALAAELPEPRELGVAVAGAEGECVALEAGEAVPPRAGEAEELQEESCCPSPPAVEVGRGVPVPVEETLGVGVGRGVVRDVGVPTSAGLGVVHGEGEEVKEACESVPMGERDSVGLTETHVVREKEGEEEAEGQGVEDALPPPPPPPPSPLQGVPDTLGLASLLPEAVPEGVREKRGESVPGGVCVTVGAAVRESVPLTVSVGCVETV